MGRPSGLRYGHQADRADWREAWALFPGSVAYIWHAGTKAGIVQDSLAACGFDTRSQIIWAKNNFRDRTAISPDGNIAALSRPKSRRATN